MVPTNVYIKDVKFRMNNLRKEEARLEKRKAIWLYLEEHTSRAALYELLAEEAAELSHASSKMARILRGEVPTPKTREKSFSEVLEEYNDVLNVSNVLCLWFDQDMIDRKLERWMDRLKAKEAESKECAEKDDRSENGSQERIPEDISNPDASAQPLDRME